MYCVTLPPTMQLQPLPPLSLTCNPDARSGTGCARIHGVTSKGTETFLINKPIRVDLRTQKATQPASALMLSPNSDQVSDYQSLRHGVGGANASESP